MAALIANLIFLPCLLLIIGCGNNIEELILENPALMGFLGKLFGPSFGDFISVRRLLFACGLLLTVVFLAASLMIGFALVNGVSKLCGNDSRVAYRTFDTKCREVIGKKNDWLRLSRPQYASDRAAKIYNCVEMMVVCLLVSIRVFVRTSLSMGRFLPSLVLAVLAVVGVLVVYGILWVIVALVGETVRIRKIRK